MHYLLLVVGDDIDAQLLPFAGWDEEKENPDARFDWYVVGGRFDGHLQLREPRRHRRLFGLLPARVEHRTNLARKPEIDPAPLLADPPAALLFRGEWHEDESLDDESPDTLWPARFAELYAQIPDDAPLTVLDCHL